MEFSLGYKVKNSTIRRMWVWYKPWTWNKKVRVITDVELIELSLIRKMK